METVQHLSRENCFVLECGGAQAVLKYHLLDGAQQGQVSAVDFTSTFVPPAFRGKGLAEKLVRTGLAWAKEQGYEIHASCWYVEKFIR